MQRTPQTASPAPSCLVPATSPPTPGPLGSAAAHAELLQASAAVFEARKAAWLSRLTHVCLYSNAFREVPPPLLEHAAGLQELDLSYNHTLQAGGLGGGGGGGGGRGGGGAEAGARPVAQPHLAGGRGRGRGKGWAGDSGGYGLMLSVAVQIPRGEAPSAPRPCRSALAPSTSCDS